MPSGLSMSQGNQPWCQSKGHDKLSIYMPYMKLNIKSIDRQTEKNNMHPIYPFGRIKMLGVSEMRPIKGKSPS